MSVQLSQYYAAGIMQKRVSLAKRDGFLDVRQGEIVSVEPRMSLMPAEIGAVVLRILPNNLMAEFKISLRIKVAEMGG